MQNQNSNRYQDKNVSNKYVFVKIGTTDITRGLRANLVGISIYQQTNACKPIILKYINIKT